MLTRTWYFLNVMRYIRVKYKTTLGKGILYIWKMRKSILHIIRLIVTNLYETFPIYVIKNTFQRAQKLNFCKKKNEFIYLFLMFHKRPGSRRLPRISLRPAAPFRVSLRSGSRSRSTMSSTPFLPSVPPHMISRHRKRLFYGNLTYK